MFLAILLEIQRIHIVFRLRNAVEMNTNLLKAETR